MGLFFDDFEQTPTPLFYVSVVTAGILIVLLLWKFFSSHKQPEYTCQKTHKSMSQGGVCLNRNEKELSITTVDECCNEYGKHHKHTWKDASQLATDCSGEWVELFNGECLVNNSAQTSYVDTCVGNIYSMFRVNRPAQYGGKCPNNHGDVKSEPCVLYNCTRHSTTRTNGPYSEENEDANKPSTVEGEIESHPNCSTDGVPVCDSSGTIVAPNECLAIHNNINDFEACAGDINVCPLIFLPVCDGNGKRIATNACEAELRGYTKFSICTDDDEIRPTPTVPPLQPVDGPCTREFKPVCDMFGNNIFIASNACVAQTQGYTKFIPCSSSSVKLCESSSTDSQEPVCDKDGVVIASRGCEALKKGFDKFSPCGVSIQNAV